ncbi:mitochondrial carrier protein LEU5 [Lindgomyces ingoldianus]|uniref:Mitochondrial carrier protein LEU5 n=1 Tax=Lindgomyces ingoldianus TaxID=673940 RepID=A0ACB6R076_9PLEO|nr:mitochondrial carrier protein LEU5 [Lindgomyces ingoldianus]KAF2471725.1 mitochondrial carrier protein LEU5 [Lindgomyces ingoldianus]
MQADTIDSIPTSKEKASIVAHDAKSSARSVERPNKHSFDYVIRSSVAGGIAGCVAKTAVAPLDRVKILFQTANPQYSHHANTWMGLGRALRDIYGRQGIRGLFRGHLATLLKIYPYAALNYAAYEQYRALLISLKCQETWIRRFSAGALAGVTTVFFTYPLGLLRVRLAFETKTKGSSLVSMIREIYHERTHSFASPQSTPRIAHEVSSHAIATTSTVPLHKALANFYRGFSITLLGMVPYAGVSFLLHDTIGDLFRLLSIRRYTTLPHSKNTPSDQRAPLRACAELTSGGLSGAISQTVAYPLEVTRRRMQVGGAVGHRRHLSIRETMGTIFRDRGISGFFVGLSIGYVKVVPLVAVSFYTYERLKMHLGI